MAELMDVSKDRQWQVSSAYITAFRQTSDVDKFFTFRSLNQI